MHSDRLYFASGSNMSAVRLRSRIPDAHKVGTAELIGYRLVFNKVGQDGSAKANAVRTGREEDVIWGVVYELPEDGMATLDQIEGEGYQRRTLAVYRKHQRLEVQSFIACRTDEHLLPFAWYVQHVLSGAMENNLPQRHIDFIADVKAVADTDTARAEREMQLHRH